MKIIIHVLSGNILLDARRWEHMYRNSVPKEVQFFFILFSVLLVWVQKVQKQKLISLTVLQRLQTKNWTEQNIYFIHDLGIYSS